MGIPCLYPLRDLRRGEFTVDHDQVFRDCDGKEFPGTLRQRMPSTQTTMIQVQRFSLFKKQPNAFHMKHTARSGVARPRITTWRSGGLVNKVGHYTGVDRFLVRVM